MEHGGWDVGGESYRALYLAVVAIKRSYLATTLRRIMCDPAHETRVAVSIWKGTRPITPNPVDSMMIQGTRVIPFGRVAEARREEGALRTGVWWDFPGLGLLRPFWKGSERSNLGFDVIWFCLLKGHGRMRRCVFV